METIVFIIVFITLGVAFGYLIKHQRYLLKKIDSLGGYAVYFLLFILGVKLGLDKGLLQQLPDFGRIALLMAVFCSLGSVLCMWGAQRCFSWFSFSKNDNVGEYKSLNKIQGKSQKENKSKSENANENVHASAESSLFSSCKILLSFCAGILVGYLQWLPEKLFATDIVLYILWVLVFSVGVGLGSNIVVFLQLKIMGKKLFCVPLFIIIGTFIGAVCASFFVQITMQESLSVAAGFGYYSLSSIIISEAGKEAVASIALISNISREILGLLTAPFIARVFGPLGPIAIAGATAMDVSLPIIARYSGSAFVIVSVFSGMLLSLLVPFMVSFILSW